MVKGGCERLVTFWVVGVALYTYNTARVHTVDRMAETMWIVELA